MPKYRMPTPEQVPAALLKIPTLQLRRVFYEGLENPFWVRPLLEAGAFTNPPEPQATDDGYVRDVYWPEISYLTRIAPQVPGDVVDVLLQLKDTKNAWVRRGVFEIGSKIPASEGAKLKPLLQAWVSSGFGWRTDPTSLVSFAVTLLEGGQTKIGRWLANILFEPRAQSQSDGLNKPELSLDDYWYEEGLPRVVTALGDNALSALTGWLSKYVNLSGHASGGYDFSGMDRPSIKDRGDSHSNPEDALIEALRDAAIPAARADPERTVAILLRPTVKLLRKIALYIVAEAIRQELDGGKGAGHLVGVAKQLLGDPASDDEYLRIEYAELAQATARIDYEALSVIGPFLEQAYASDLAWMRERLVVGDEQADVDEADIHARADRYRHSWLSAIGSNALPADLQQELAKLDESNGVVDDPLVPIGRVTSWSGPNPHTTQHEMVDMSPTELVVLLANWHDKGDGWGPEPSHEGQGRELSGLLTTNPLALAGVSNLIEQLRPTYLRAILHGWEAALKADLDLDWSQATELIAEVLKHPIESTFPVEGGDFDDDKDFRGAKSAAIGLLEELLKKRGTVVVPDEYESQLATLLIQTADDNAAWTEYDSYTPSGDGWDPLTISINWQWPGRVRGLILAATRSAESPWQSEALKAVESELARPDRHGAVRAVLGEGFGRLLNHAPEWLNTHLEDLIGSESGISVDQQIVLTTAMATHHYHRDLFNLFSPSMIAAIGVGDALTAGWRESDPLPRIGEWAINAVIYGHKTTDDLVVRTFFSSASPEARGEAMGKIAWGFFRAEKVDDSIRERFGELWDSRIQHVREHPEDSKELNGIYWLAKGDKFPPDWWLPRLRDSLELDPTIASERYMIGKEIAHASTGDPSTALAVMKLLLSGRAESGMVSFDLSRNAVPVVLANAIASGDSVLKRDAEAYMNELGAKGNLTLESEVTAALKGDITAEALDD